MKFNKKIFLSSLLACLSLNSCYSMEYIKNFFSNPWNASVLSSSSTLIIIFPIAFKIGSIVQIKKSKESTQELEDNCKTIKALRDEILTQNNYLADRTTKQQHEINNLIKENESLKKEIKYYKRLFSDIFGTFQKFSDFVLEIKNKIYKNNNVASENLEPKEKVQQHDNENRPDSK